MIARECLNCGHIQLAKPDSFCRGCWRTDWQKAHGELADMLNDINQMLDEPASKPLTVPVHD